MTRSILFTVPPVSAVSLFRSVQRCGPLLAALVFHNVAGAQPAPLPPTDTAANAPQAPSRQVGDATHNLFALQSGGSQASATPRPIAGDTAQLSYQRYLKSFETPIPEHFLSTVKSSSSAGGR